MLKLFADSLIVAGALFILLASIGIWRLPDLYLKLHAATKVGTLGCGLILLGVGLQFRDAHSITEVLLLILFVAITNPISAHLIGRLRYISPKTERFEREIND